MLASLPGERVAQLHILHTVGGWVVCGCVSLHSLRVRLKSG